MRQSPNSGFKQPPPSRHGQLLQSSQQVFYPTASPYLSRGGAVVSASPGVSQPPQYISSTSVGGAYHHHSQDARVGYPPLFQSNNFMKTDGLPISQKIQQSPYPVRSYSPSVIPAATRVITHPPSGPQIVYRHTPFEDNGFNYPTTFESTVVARQIKTTQLLSRQQQENTAANDLAALNEVQLDRIRVFKKQNIERVFGRDVEFECNYDPLKLFSAKDLRGFLTSNFEEFEKNLKKLEADFTGLESSFFHLLHKGESPKDLFDRFLVSLDRRVETFFETFDEAVIQNRGPACDHFDVNVLRNDFEFWNFKSVIKQGIVEISNKLNDAFLARDNSTYYDAQVMRSVESIIKLYGFLKSDFNTILHKSALKYGKILEACTYDYQAGEGLKSLNFAEFLHLDVAALVSTFSDDFERSYPVMLNKKQIVAERFHDILRDKSTQNSFDFKQLVRSIYSRERRKVYRTIYNVIAKNGKGVLELGENLERENKLVTEKMNRIKMNFLEVKANPIYLEVLSGRLNFESLRSSPTLFEDSPQTVLQLENFMVSTGQLIEDMRGALSDIIGYKEGEQQHFKEVLSSALSNSVFDLNQMEKKVQEKGDMSEFLLYQFQSLEAALASDNTRENVESNIGDNMMHQLGQNSENYHLHNIAADIARESKEKDMKRQTLQENQKKKTVENSQKISSLMTRPLVDKERPFYETKEYDGKYQKSEKDSGQVKGLADKLLLTIKMRREEDIEKERRIREEQEMIRLMKELQLKDERERIEDERKSMLEQAEKKFREKKDREQDEWNKRVQARERENEERRAKEQSKNREEAAKKESEQENRRRAKEEADSQRERDNLEKNRKREEEQLIRVREEEQRQSNKQRQAEEKTAEERRKKEAEEDRLKQKRIQDDLLKKQQEDDQKSRKAKEASEKEELARKRQLAEDDKKKRIEDDNRRKADEEERKRKQNEEDEKKRQGADELRRKKREEDEARKKQEDDRRKLEEAEKLQRKEEAAEQKKRDEEVRKKREEEDRKKLEEKRKAEEDTKRKGDADRKQREEEKQQRKEEERIQKENQERLQKEEEAEDRRKKDEEKRRKDEQERIRKAEDEQRKQKEEADKRKKDEEDKRKKDEEDKRKKDEEVKRKKDEEDKRKKDLEDKRRRDEEEEQAAQQKEEEEEEERRREEEAKKLKQAQESKKQPATSGFDYGKFGASDEISDQYENDFDGDEFDISDQPATKPNVQTAAKQDLFEDIMEDSDNYNEIIGKFDADKSKPKPKPISGYDDFEDLDDDDDISYGQKPQSKSALPSIKQPSKPTLPSLPTIKAATTAAKNGDRFDYNYNLDDDDDDFNEKSAAANERKQTENDNEYNYDFEEIEDEIDIKPAAKTTPIATAATKPITKKPSSQFDYDYDIENDEDDDQEVKIPTPKKEQPKKPEENKKQSAAAAAIAAAAAQDDYEVDFDYDMPEEIEAIDDNDDDDYFSDKKVSKAAAESKNAAASAPAAKKGSVTPDQLSPEEMEEMLKAQEQEQQEMYDLTYKLIEKTNEYVKKTRFGRSNHVNLNKFNNFDSVIRIYEEYIQNGLICLFDLPESEGLMQVFELYANQADEFEQAAADIIQQIQVKHEEQTQLMEFNPSTNLYFFLQPNQFGFQLIEVSIATKTISYFFMVEDEEEEVMEQLMQFHGFLLMLFEWQGFEPSPMKIEDNTLKVLQIYEKEPYLQFMIMLFPLTYEFLSELSTIIVDHSTIERIFYIQLSLENFYEELQESQEAVAAKFDGILKQYQENDDFFIFSQAYEGFSESTFEQILQDLNQVKMQVLENPATRYGLANFEIIIDQNPFVYYFYVQRSADEEKEPHEIGFFCLSLFEPVNSQLVEIVSQLAEDGSCEFRPHNDQPRHNGLYEYHDFTLACWAQLIDKKKLPPFVAINVLNFSMIPYYVIYKGID